MTDGVSTTQVAVMGRLCADLYPEQLRTPLAEVETFRRFVGGFAGNVATGLARLGVDCAIVSAVGDDGFGEYVRGYLEREGVDCRHLSTHPTLRTALAFCEAWPPDRFPITFYRTPTCPDWELRFGDLDVDALVEPPLALVTGTGLAREPSRTATLGVLRARAARGMRTIFDADWRAQLWEAPEEYPVVAGLAAEAADIVVGGDGELEAAGLGPESADVVVIKHGPDGVTVHQRGASSRIPPMPVEVVNGLGAGDAFLAAFSAGLLEGLDPVAAARRGSGAGALVATRLACSDAMPTRPELEEFLGAHA
ncbi:MAG: 5-dehydro-2-deoxygluconokinase [Gaiellales bacterium]|nr:5-dehydro-2-deoxygluconokinase [Gaiellales bacterium]